MRVSKKKRCILGGFRPFYRPRRPLGRVEVCSIRVAVEEIIQTEYQLVGVDGA
jgi:hypothetical protein